VADGDNDNVKGGFLLDIAHCLDQKKTTKFLGEKEGVPV
jgi:hypothetical protein